MGILSKFKDPPIVIGGCGRSGTSLLLSILSSDPRILTIPGETIALCPTAYDKKVDLNAPLKMEVIEKAICKYGISPSTTRWCEKTPKNIIFIAKILNYFGENVRFINVIRDGRDVLTSNHPDQTERYYISWERWINDVSAGVPYDFHPQVLVLKYEDIITKLNSTISKIYNFLEEDIHPNLFEWHVHAEVRQHKAWSGEVGKIFSTSIGRWKHLTSSENIKLLLSNPRAIELLKHYWYMDIDGKAENRWALKYVIQRCKMRLPVGLRILLSNLR